MTCAICVFVISRKEFCGGVTWLLGELVGVE